MRVVFGGILGMLVCLCLYDVLYSQLLFPSNDYNKHVTTVATAIQALSSDQPFGNNAKTQTVMPTSKHNDSAYVFLGLGVQANQLNCPAAIESLVRIGKWDGHVFMLTDRKSCFNRNKIIHESGIHESRFHIVDMDESFGDGGVDLKNGFRKNRKQSMAVKSYLFDYLPANIQTIVYADCDIIFGNPGCPADYMHAGPSWDDARLKFSRVYYVDDGGERRTDGIHCGTFVAHREHSKLAMELWGKELETLDSEGDNGAYRKAYLSLQNEMVRRGLKQPPSSTDNSAVPAGQQAQLRAGIEQQSVLRSHVLDEFFKQVSNEEFKSKYMLSNGKANILEPGDTLTPTGDRYEKFFDPTLKDTCMLHVSKARCTTYGREGVQEVVDKFELKTYKRPHAEGSYPYCSHPYLQPMLYGWFPFSWWPYCPKIETIL
jgi:hypothetical protein